MPNVLVYSPNILPYSQTFIKEQITAYKRWVPILAGKNYIFEQDVSELNTVLIGPGTTESFTGRLVQKFYEYVADVPESTLTQVNNIAPWIIHAHFGTSAVEVYPIARALDIPLIVTLHGSDVHTKPSWWESGAGGLAKKNYPERLRRLSQWEHVRFVAVSKNVEQAAILYGLPREKLVLSYIGVDVSLFQPSALPPEQRKNSVLFVGRLIESKGCEYFIRAASIAKIEVPDLEVIVGGTGPMLSRLKNLSEHLGVNAKFLGALSHQAVRREMDRTRLLCVPSIELANGQSEGLGLVLLEAQASGVPVIGSSIGGIPEAMIDGKTGFLTDSGDAVMLADRMVRILKDVKLSREMSDAARNFVVDNFNIDVLSGQVEALYDEVLNRYAMSRWQTGVLRSALP
jgi:glycosyltransferase involved in cell wall biosynthesis